MLWARWLSCPLLSVSSALSSPLSLGWAAPLRRVRLPRESGEKAQRWLGGKSRPPHPQPVLHFCAVHNDRYNTAQHSTAQHSAALYCTALHLRHCSALLMSSDSSSSQAQLRGCILCYLLSPRNAWSYLSERTVEVDEPDGL